MRRLLRIRRRTSYRDDLRADFFAPRFAVFLRAPPFFAPAFFADDFLRADPFLALLRALFFAAMVISPVKELNARSNPRWFGRASGQRRSAFPPLHDFMAKP